MSNLIREWFEIDNRDVYMIEEHFPAKVARIRQAISLQAADAIVCGLIDTLSAGPVEGLAVNTRAFFLERLRGCREQAWSSLGHSIEGPFRRGPQFTR